MATPTTLYEYYQSKGKKLPTWQERAPLFEQYGFGKASEYAGTEPQNVLLLGALQKGETAPVAMPGGTPAPTPISPTVTPPELGGVAPEVSEPVKEPSAVTGGDAKDELIKKLTDELTRIGASKTGEEELRSLQEERGWEQKKEIVGTFDEEIGKAQDLLADLDQSLKRGMLKEEGRIATEEVVRGKQEQLEKMESIKRGDVLATISSLERGKERAESVLEREEGDILRVLGLREQERKRPLEDLREEIAIRKTIRDLTKKDIPDVTSSTFDSDGNLTIVTQDPGTGEFSTQTIEGIGKKTYDRYFDETDDQGNVTFFGVKDGKAEQLGTFNAVGKTPQPSITEQKQQAISDMVQRFKTGVDDNGQPIIGKDGYVSPESFKKARDEWQAQGLSISDFEKEFANFINPTHYQDYLLSKEAKEGTTNDQNLEEAIEALNKPWWKFWE